jgi:Ser/Thr protein kinase RdoA (MazF antagonist)
LHDTLPGFHVTPGYLIEFDAVVAKGGGGPDWEGLAEALEFVESRRPCADVLELARSHGRLKPHVIHGDPKLDNVLFDIASGQAVSLIDLDTVKPGLLHYDLGDCFRSCCNKVSETVETGGAAFDVGVFRAVLQGYLREASSILTREDLDYLYDAIRLLPFELGLRFLTDHLAGNVYFKVQAPGQNLERALGQFRLSASVETFEGDIRRVLAALT